MEKFEPMYGEKYWCVDFGYNEMVSWYTWCGDSADKKILNTCGCYRTKEEAIAKAKEMLGIYVIDGVEYRSGEIVEVNDSGCGVWLKREFVGFINNSIVCKDIAPFCYFAGVHNWSYIRKLTPQPLVGKTVEVKVDGKTYVAEIKEEK